MIKPLTVPPKTGHKTLLYSELATDLDNLEADIAVLGMPYGSAYSAADFTNDQTNAPTAIRQATDRVVRSPGHYDFDIDGPLLQERDDIRFVDCGDVIADLAAPGSHYERVEAVVRKILTSTQISDVVCATDAGREGELIFRYVYEAAGCDKPVRRLWISSLTPEAIRRGFASLRDGRDMDPLADAARGRSRADWLVGMNLSRACSLAFDEDLSVDSVGDGTLTFAGV